MELANPSIIFVGFGKFDRRFEKFKIDAEKRGIVLRELKIFDIQIPIDNRYNEATNFLKQNITLILKKYFDFSKLPFIPKLLKKKFQLEPFDYNEFKKHFTASNYYPYGYLGLLPILIDTKYENAKLTKEERRNYEKLKNLKSKNYKPLLTPTAEERYFKTWD